MAVGKLVVDFAACPLCFGLGEVDTMANQRGQRTKNSAGIPLCRICHGWGSVDRARTCECGRYAALYHAVKKVWFCGSQVCADSALRRKEGKAHFSAYNPSNYCC